MTCQNPPKPAPSSGGDALSAPLVSVIMANYRGAAFLEAAILSVLAQTCRHLELIVSDDASDDDSRAIVGRLAEADPRVRLIANAVNGGPSRARNAALDVARGAWIAIVDSDDLLHPDRFSRLLAAAARHRADLVADDMVPFGVDLQAMPGTMFARRLAEGPIRIGAAGLLGSGAEGLGAAEFGYLKPIIRRGALGRLRYDETLRNSEDLDLYLRLVLGGARFVLMPDPTYLYRRHGGSISHRLTPDVLVPLLAAHEAMPAPENDAEVTRAMRRRRTALRRALRYARLVAAIKDRAAGRAAALILRQPVLLLDLAESLRDRRRSRPDAGQAPVQAHPRLVLAAPGDHRSGSAEGAETVAFAQDPGPDGHGVDAEPAARLCDIWRAGPPDVVAVGSAGLRGVGYLPGYRSLELHLSRREAEACADRIPADAVVTIRDRVQSGGDSSSRQDAPSNGSAAD